jgi:hypothetical protein
MKNIIVFIFMASGVLFLGRLIAGSVPKVQHVAFNLGSYHISYWVVLLVAMGLMAFWALRGENKKKGR